MKRNEEDETLLEISDTETVAVDAEFTTSENQKRKIDSRIRQYDFKHNWLKLFNCQPITNICCDW